MAVARKKRRASLDADVSLHKAAQALGRPRQSVLSLIVAGDLEGRPSAGRTVVDRKSLNRLLARLGRPTL